MASLSSRTAALLPRFFRKQSFLLVFLLLICLYQLRVSFSVEKRLISASVFDGLLWRQPPALRKTNVPANNTNMSACLLVMDDTIKLTEWIAYHYTVLPLSHLIVAIDPASVLHKEIQDVLDLWKPHLSYIDVWTNDTWMTLNATTGWPPGAYDLNKTLLVNRIHKVPSWKHKRRQEHFSIQCMRKLKNIHPSWVLNMDMDEFLIYNYIDQDEDNTTFLAETDAYRKMTIRERNRTKPIRARLPKLDDMTIGEFLAKASMKKKCIKVPGLQMSARESTLTQVFKDVPSGIDARTLMTLRHRKYGNKEGNFTKTLLDLQRIGLGAMQQQMVRTIHSPLAQVCGKHADKYIGFDYISSIFRLHHYAGTPESFDERMHDARKGRNESFSKRNVDPIGENDDVRPWIAAFVKKVGITEAQRLLQPLKDAYKNTDWSALWNTTSS